MPFMMLTPAPVAAPDQKCHVGLHFDCIDLRNAIMLSTVLLASGDINASAKGVT